MDAFEVSASALTAQRMRMDVIASNLANANTTRLPDGTIGAYKRRNVMFAPLLQEAMGGSGGGEGGPQGHQSFANAIGLKPSSTMHQASAMAQGSPHPVLKAGISKTAGMAAMGVQITQIIQDSKSPDRLEYNPSHPDADADGFVHYPNINVVTEMVDMISASRSYEANVNAIMTTKTMGQAALQI